MTVNNAVHIETNIFPIAALLVILNNLRHDMSFSWRRHCVEVIMKLSIFIMFFNTVGWCLNGADGDIVNIVLWIVNTAYYVFMLYMSFLWFLYVYDKVTNGNGQMGASVIKKAIPIFICFAMLAAGVVKPLIFYIGDDNCYHRGPLYPISLIVASGYIFAACLMSFIKMLKVLGRDERKQYGFLVLFGVFPLVGSVVQTLFYGMDVLWPLTTAALVMVYINIQQQNLSRDGMTGLNNRRRLDQYVDALSREHIGKESICYSIMDIDYFKEINDTLGHQTGDKVLCLVADALKKVYGNSRSFIAKYGGDEFVIISRGFDKAQSEYYCKKLQKLLRDIDCTELDGRVLTISVGSAFYGESGCSKIRDMMELADERMYRVKQKHHDKDAFNNNQIANEN